MRDSGGEASPVCGAFDDPSGMRCGLKGESCPKYMEGVEGNTDGGGVEGIEKKVVNKLNQFIMLSSLLRSFSSNNSSKWKMSTAVSDDLPSEMAVIASRILSLSSTSFEGSCYLELQKP